MAPCMGVLTLTPPSRRAFGGKLPQLPRGKWHGHRLAGMKVQDRRACTRARTKRKERGAGTAWVLLRSTTLWEPRARALGHTGYASMHPADEPLPAESGMEACAARLTCLSESSWRAPHK